MDALWTPAIHRLSLRRIREAQEEARSHGYLGVINIDPLHPLAGLRERLVMHEELRISILLDSGDNLYDFVSLDPMRVFGIEVEHHFADPERFPLMLYTYDLEGLPRQKIILHHLEAVGWEQNGSTVAGSDRFPRCPHCDGFLPPPEKTT